MSAVWPSASIRLRHRRAIHRPVLGGLLAAFAWRAVFLVSVPFGIIGTVWAYLMLHETVAPGSARRLTCWAISSLPVD